MPDKYIVNMTEKTTPEDTNLLVIEDAVDTKKITFANLVKPIKDTIDNLLESGSNDNGTYIRFSDGTQICTRSVDFDATIDVEQGRTFPASFIEVYFTAKQLDGSKTLVTAVNTSRYNNIVCYDKGTSYWTLRTRSPGVDTPTLYLKLFAIGRWK